MIEGFKHFYRNNYNKRLKIIEKFSHLNEKQIDYIKQNNIDRNHYLIENYLTDYSLPEGTAVNLKVNGKEYVVPMVIEEPSVIAAASNGAEMLSDNDGIQAEVKERLLTGQIIVQGCDYNLLKEWIQHNYHDLIQIADNAHPSIIRHNGGAHSIHIRQLDDEFCSIDILVNVSESMGANTVNSMLEAITSYIHLELDININMSILSNYADHSLVTATGKIKLSRLTTKKMTGADVASKIGLASYIAQIDVHRATTHNKGIMNGVDAITIASGNDWRAIESGVHAYAARNGQYRGLSQWKVKGEYLIGKITLPLPLGIVGGATKVLPMVSINQQLTQIKSAKELMKLVASVGLAQNLAALKALVTSGIQRGHMRLQMRSLAISAGASNQELPLVVRKLRQLKNIDLKQTQQIIKEIRNKD